MIQTHDLGGDLGLHAADAEGDARRRDFEALYDEWRTPLVRLCRRYLGRHGDAEAVAHEAFLRAWSSWHRYSPDYPFWPWIATIARRLCINEATRRGRRELVTSEVPPVKTPPSGENELDRVFETEAVGRSLRELSPRHRRVLALRDLEGWSYEEIARFDDVTVETVRSSLKRARVAFRQAYCRFSETMLCGLGGVLYRLRARVSRLHHEAEHTVGLVGSRWSGWDTVVAAAVASLLASAASVGAVERRPVPQVAPGIAAPETTVAAPVMTGPAGGEAGKGGAPATTAAGTSVSPPSSAGPSGADVFDPADGRQYEFTASPSYEEDHTVFAAGTARQCEPGLDVCTVLLRSTDGGRTWRRLPAAGRPQGRILLPPDYPRDNRIFSLSIATLSVSRDDGRTFEPLAAVQGPGAMSPLFSAGDPRIVFGSDPLRAVPVATEYRDDVRLVRPLALDLPELAAPAAFAFSPTYAKDRSVLVSAVEQRHDVGLDLAQVNTDLTWSVYSCTGSSCALVLDTKRGGLSPWVLWGTSPQPVALAGTPDALYRSVDGGRSFQEIAVPGQERSRKLGKVAIAPDGRMFATVFLAGRAETRLYASDDDGRSWTLLDTHRTAWLVMDLATLPDGTVLAGPADGAIRCSRDDGRTWADGCSVPAPRH